MRAAKAQAASSIDARADAYADLGRFSTVAIGGAFGVAVHGSIVRQYVRAYLLEHGRFPTGRHRAQGKWEGKTIRFETRFPSRAVAALAAIGCQPGREELWGVSELSRRGAFGRARREYLHSPGRPRLRAWLLLQLEEAIRNPPPTESE